MPYIWKRSIFPHIAIRIDRDYRQLEHTFYLAYWSMWSRTDGLAGISPGEFPNRGIFCEQNPCVIM